MCGCERILENPDDEIFDLGDKEFKFGELDMEMGGIIGLNDDGSADMEISLSAGGGRAVASSVVKIKYCPMCGRRLCES